MTGDDVRRAPQVDALAAAVRLESAVAGMRARAIAGGPTPDDDEPPTGLLDLAAIRAALGAPAEDVDPAAAAWLAGGPDPAAARIVEQVDQLKPWGPPGVPWTLPAPTEDDEQLDEPLPDILDIARAVDQLADEPERDCACGAGITVRGGPLGYRTELAGVSHGATPCYRVEPAAVVGPYVAGGQVPAEPTCDATDHDHTTSSCLGPLEQQLVEPLEDTQVHVPESAAPTSAEPVAVAPPRPTSARVFRTEHEPRPGWSSRHDPRSLAYGIRPRLGVAPLQDVDLPLGPVLDQGQEGECVGCGTVDATNVLRLLAGRRDLLKIDAAAALYHRAQVLDDVPGVDYSGTSVLAGMQAGVEAGYFGGYLWAFGTRDIATALGHLRPVVIGIPWLSGMYDTGPGGLVEVKGDDTGAGHCLAVVKLRMKGPQGQPGPYFGWLNSWGRSYGDNGVGWVHHRDLAALLHGRGEAAIPGSTS